MVNCPSCGAQNLDNAKYCCQCAAVMGSGKREFIQMCGDDSEKIKQKSVESESRAFQSMDNYFSKRPVERSNAFALENSSNDEDDYAKYRMRDSSEIFNGDESNVFSKNSRDVMADRKRRRDSAKLVKRAEKQAEKKRRDGSGGFESTNNNWKGNDFWS